VCSCGGGSWDIGGIANCCGDDSSEYVQTVTCDAYLTCPSGDACCDQTSDCVWNNVCYNDGAGHPSLGGVSCADGVWKDTRAPVTSITPDGGDFTGQNETSFTLTCSDTGGSDCSKTYYKIINDGEVCGSAGFTDGNSGDVTCPFGQTCDKRVCYYSTDNAGNQEAVKQSNIFHLETNACMGKQCGEACLVITGVCDGDWGNCYTEGGCLLDCSEPSLGPGDQRIWANQNCGRTGSYKCGPTSVCSNSYTSCTTGGTSTQVTGSWSSYIPASGFYDDGDTVQIRINGISNQPSGFTVLTECVLIKPNGNVVYFDNWGSGNIIFSYTIQATDPEGVWTIDYCGLWSDFLANDGWELQMNQTDFTFTVDKTPPSIIINSPTPGFYSSSFLVNATVTDAWSEVAGVSYRWKNGTDMGQWTSMPRQTGTDFFTANFDASGLADGDYTIRVKANDTLGHEIEGTVDIMIDVTPPDITINIPSPNTWYRSDFTVTATVTEQTSGVDGVYYRWENSTSTGPWVLMTDNYPTFTSPFAISSVKDGLYTFRVKANDTTGNENNASVGGVGVDDEPPVSAALPLEDFITATRFNITWEGSDNESGIDCYVVQYRYNDTSSLSDWENLTINGGTCTTETETEFDTTSVAPNPNKYTFHFRSLARDNAGNWETKTAEDTKTMIFIPVLTHVYAFDPLTGFVIPNGGKASANRPILIIAENKSPGIGPLNFTLTYYNHTPGSNPLTGMMTTDTKNDVYSINLTAGPYQGYKTQVSYYVEAWDGLIYERNPPEPFLYYFTMYTHPLANFVVTGTLQTRLGRTELVGIEVRNIQTKYDKVSLELDSEYARFVENGLQNINVSLNPQEEKIVYARLYPSGLEGYTLNLDAHSLIADPTLDDADTIRIAIFMPTEFPGLNLLGVSALLIISVLIYLKFVTRDSN